MIKCQYWPYFQNQVNGINGQIQYEVCFDHFFVWTSIRTQVSPSVRGLGVGQPAERADAFHSSAGG